MPQVMEAYGFKILLLDDLLKPFAEIRRQDYTSIFLAANKSVVMISYNDTRKQDRQNGENKLEWNHGKEKEFCTPTEGQNSA